MTFNKPVLVAAACMVSAGTAFAQAQNKIPAPLFPVDPVLAEKGVDEIYPSIAGNFLVYSLREKHIFSVERRSKRQPQTGGRRIDPSQPQEAIRFGVALSDGAIGYTSNRMGPISAWMKQAHGDGHVSIANLGTFNGALMPMDLEASDDGRIWAFGTSMDKTQRSRFRNEYNDAYMHYELLGQRWRNYSSDAFRYKQGYFPTKTGNANKFPQPALFIFDISSSQFTMIPNAFNGTISPDGRRIAFVRETNGNYDVWMQDVSGGNLTQLTSTEFGEFEPSWSPDGKRIAFVSNRDSKGDVRATSIYVLDLKNGRTLRLTNAPKATDGSPAWMDDHTILFHSNRNPDKPQASTVSEWNIWQVNFKGGF